MLPEQQIANLAEVLWKKGGGSESGFQKAAKAAYRLSIQLAVQFEFDKTADVLRKSPPDETLPNQLCDRFGLFLKFLCEGATENTDRQKENTDGQKQKMSRPEQLRTLNIDAQIFCGLCYPVHRLKILSLEQFNFIIEKITAYVEWHGLAGYLYRKDLDKKFTDFEHSFRALGHNPFLESLAKAHLERRSNVDRAFDIDRESTQTGEPELSLQKLTLDDLNDIVNSNQIGQAELLPVNDKCYGVKFLVSFELGKVYERKLSGTSVVSATEA